MKIRSRSIAICAVFRTPTSGEGASRSRLHKRVSTISDGEITNNGSNACFSKTLPIPHRPKFAGEDEQGANEA